MRERVFHHVHPSPLGDLLLLSDGEALTRLSLDGSVGPPDPSWVRDEGPFRDVAAQLDEYFAGARTAFDLELAPRGTAFQRAVWDALLDIPYGETASYSEVARRIGRPTAVRAVGAANNRNRVAIVIPCHRVIGANGALVGYGGGLWRKERLLALERGSPGESQGDRGKRSRHPSPARG